METRDLYEEELESEFEQIKDIDIASDEHRMAVADISQLTDRLVKLKEVENERLKIEYEQQKIDIERARADAEKEKVAIEREKIVVEKEKADIEAKKIDIEQGKVKIEELKLEDEQKDRRIKNVISALGIAIPAGLTLTGMVLMFLFEEKGTITSRAGSKIVDRIFRGK